MIKKRSHIEATEYTYDTREERESHIKQMEEAGWQEDGGKIRMLKDGASIYNPTHDDYSWYARFTINKMN
jgi:hypothetical protein